MQRVNRSKLQPSQGLTIPGTPRPPGCYPDVQALHLSPAQIVEMRSIAHHHLPHVLLLQAFLDLACHLDI